MKLKEFINELEKLSADCWDYEVTMADMCPVTLIDVINSNGCIVISDNVEEDEIDVDEQMHEQEDRDAELAECEAEMYESMLGGF